MKRNKFALPSGFATQYGIPISADNSAVEGHYSNMSFELMDANLAALEKVYMGIGYDGVDGVGIYEKLKEYNAQSTVVDGDLASHTVYMDTVDATTEIIQISAENATQHNVVVTSNETYFWRVVTLDQSGNSSDSGTYAFRVN